MSRRSASNAKNLAKKGNDGITEESKIDSTLSANKQAAQIAMELEPMPNTIKRDSREESVRASKSQDKQKKQHPPFTNIFIPDRITDQQLQEYLKFVKSISPDIINNNIGLVLSYSEEQALEFLHKMNYSIIRAKFNLLFPTLYRYNQYHSEHPVEITEKEMEDKITFFFDQMQETKTTQQEKWRIELQDLLTDRIPLSRLASFLDQGKYSGIKSEIPDFLKDMYEKMSRFSKEIKKVMGGKVKLETLEKYHKTALTEHKIISPEMEALDEGIEKSKTWLHKLEGIEKKGSLTIRGLESLLNDYKSIPIEYSGIGNLKKVYSEAKELLDKLSNFGRSQKTRNTVTSEKIPVEIAKEYAGKIHAFHVKCEEFEAFLSSLETALQVIERIMMSLEDEKVDKNSEIMQEYLQELSNIAFTTNVTQRVQAYSEYFTIIKRMKENISQKEMLDSVKEDLKLCASKGFASRDITLIQGRVDAITQWNAKTDEILKRKQTFKIEMMKILPSPTSTPTSPSENRDMFDNFLSEEFIEGWIDKGKDLNLPEGQLARLENFSNKFKKWKMKVNSDEGSNLSDFVEKLVEGVAFQIKCSELNKLMEGLEASLKWTVKVLCLIRGYEPQFKSSYLTEHQLTMFFNQTKTKPERSENDILLMEKLIGEAEKSNYDSNELEKLKALQKQSQTWQERSAKTVANQEEQTENNIKYLLEECKHFPANESLKNQLRDLHHNNIWKGKTNDFFGSNVPNEVNRKKMLEFGVTELAKALEQIEDFEKQNVVDFFCEHRERMENMIQFIVSCQPKKKESKFNTAFLDNLIRDSDTLSNLETAKPIIARLTATQKDAMSWLALSSKLKNSDKRKKARASRKTASDKASATKDEEAKGSKELSVEGSQVKKSNKQTMEEEISTPVNGNINGNEASAVKNNTEAAENGDKMVIESFGDEPLLGGEKSQAERENQPELQSMNDGGEKKSKRSVDKMQQQKMPKRKHLVKSDSYYYYFKIPFYLVHYYEGEMLNIYLSELLTIKDNLQEIYSYQTKLRKALKKKLTIDELESIIEEGLKFKIYMLELDEALKLLKWVSNWSYIADKVLKAIPSTKLYFKKSVAKERKAAHHSIGDGSEYKIVGDKINVADYHIHFDDKNFEFILTSKDKMGSEDLSIKSSVPDSPKEDKKYTSRREKKLSSKIRDSSFAMYSSDFAHFTEHSLTAKKTRERQESPVTYTGGKRRAPVHYASDPVKKVKKINKKSLIQDETNLIEENPYLRYCICRRGHDNIAFMICCEKCNEWFHGDCVGLPKNLQNNTPNAKELNFTCPACAKRHNHPLSPVLE